jgi:hypothetical protein
MYQGASEGTQQSLAAPKTPSHSMALALNGILLLLTLIVVIAGGGLLYYIGIARPADLHVQATVVAHNVQTAQMQTATAGSPQYLYNQITSKKPVLNDSFEHETNAWENNNEGSNICTISDNAYHIRTNPRDKISYCFNHESSYDNFLFQVTMTINHADTGGIIFRSKENYKTCYMLTLYSNGIYALVMAMNGVVGKILIFDRNPAIHTGMPQTNLIAVMAQGNKFDVFINRQFVGSAEDNTFSTGDLALIATSTLAGTGDVSFHNAQLWKL